jgi:hypothetical protein
MVSKLNVNTTPKKNLLQRISGVGKLVFSQMNLLESELNLTLPALTLSYQFTKNHIDPHPPTSNTPSASFKTKHKIRNKLSSNSCTINGV